MSIVAIIPARAGSKGIKDKNLREVGGVSLVGRAIRSAKKTQKIDKVYVSTDSPLISEEAIRWGAEPISRPAELSTDESTSESAIEHALEGIGTVDIIVFIQCTSPFIQASSIDSAIELVQSGEADSVFSGVEDHGFRWESSNSGLQPLGHNPLLRTRRQDLPVRYLETGAFFVFRPDGFIKSGSRFHGRVACVTVPQRYAMEVDYKEQLELANSIEKFFDPHFSMSNFDRK